MRRRAAILSLAGVVLLVILAWPRLNGRLGLISVFLLSAFGLSVYVVVRSLASMTRRHNRRGFPVEAKGNPHEP